MDDSFCTLLSMYREKYFAEKYLSEIQMPSKTFVHLISIFYKL